MKPFRVTAVFPWSRLAQEVQGYSGQCAGRYLDSLIMLLPGDAADWAESHPDAIGCYTATPLQDIVSFFPTPVSPKLPFQSRWDGLETGRTAFGLLQAVGGTQRPEQISLIDAKATTMPTSTSTPTSTPLLKICYGLWCRHATDAGHGDMSVRVFKFRILDKALRISTIDNAWSYYYNQAANEGLVEISDFDVRAVKEAHVKRSIHTSLFKDLLIAASRHHV